MRLSPRISERTTFVGLEAQTVIDWFECRHDCLEQLGQRFANLTCLGLPHPKNDRAWQSLSVGLSASSRPQLRKVATPAPKEREHLTHDDSGMGGVRFAQRSTQVSAFDLDLPVKLRTAEVSITGMVHFVQCSHRLLPEDRSWYAT